ncbi:MAG: acetyl-CoA hydrolase/transferase family protein [Rhodospirillaceae bacterium]|jgi:4-hydroxybutyrate CoA-transferase|nr:acetyl-CoA hydrolase/transferase family protein [Rhodospirillaceae bacterium]MBT3494444.1 acetyl-CoA hydrolase/transferase family protein [Rhodospirillaceae bacterium]MBT3778601.1 acetyl-CoA hydrolase/transferase family protein [Rhodospirillaceae bacterium]MBT3978517.1 acetyl-CoA hydrolase/transferase family protein [Rhodospirillaceae bacterium]MBT4167159.1 acetyl-CoA hydrolase/transferase family protein [Rhodospirillaceae bacterium]
MPKTISPADVPALLQPGHTVFVQGAVGEPLALGQALAADGEASRGVHYVSCLVPGINRTDFSAFHPDARLTAFFVQAELRESFAAGKIRFLPLHYSGICSYMKSLPAMDILLMQVAPPDENGMCSLGLSVDFVPMHLDKAKVVVAEVNANMPSPPGSPKIPYDRLDYVLPTARALPELPTGDLPAVIETIGQKVAALIGDGDCIQIGIGKVPAAILGCLKDRRDLGLHGGMVTDEVADLVDAGALNCSQKSIDRNTLICGAAMGTQRVFDWAADRTDIQFRGADYTHCVPVVAQIDNFVSINSTLEVDLTGQANSETINARQISGTGGLVDFVRGARMANNGRSVLALSATAAAGKISRIVPTLQAGAAVSCPRADTDYVVTEFGAARMKDKSVDERAEALIAIADPKFHGELSEAWKEQRQRMGGR